MGENPAWDQFREYISEDKWEAATEKFSEWDKGVNAKFEEVAPFKPYIEKYDPETLGQIVSFAENLRENPVDVYNELQQHLQSQGLLNTQPDIEIPTAPNDGEEDEWVEDPRIPLLTDGYYTLLEREKAREEEMQDQMVVEAFNDELEQMKVKYAPQANMYGEFDEDYVIAKVGAAGMDLEEAVQSYYQWAESRLQSLNRPDVPRPLAASGVFQMGNDTVDFSKLEGSALKEAKIKFLKGLNANQ